MSHKIKIATRSSKLALWQANYIQDLLEKNGIESELLTFETKGDKILDVSLGKIGSKGLFTEELEQCLLNGTADIAVHSAKDLPSSLPRDLEIIAFTEREEFHDVLVSDQELDFTKPFRIGSSSTRRIALLSKYYPQLEVVPMRGNLQTRIKKMRDGDCDALMLAYAGVFRMGYAPLIKHQFDALQIVPPVGQGALAIEASVTINSVLRSRIIEICNNPQTNLCLSAERNFLAYLNGGCSVPIFAKATLFADKIELMGGIISLDGKKEIRVQSSTNQENAINLGIDLAKELLAKGGDIILEEIKKQL
jgi:hydroxymethylbilane synthase